MSGHSKWSQIKRQKGAADVKRSATFSKLANAIILSAKSGNDPSTNFSLRMAIEKARLENMPKENIERAIKRGSGESGEVVISEATYEVIAPFAVAIIITAATDNKNRTNSELKNIVSRFGGKIASSGAVVYQFDKVGKIIIDLKDQSKEEAELSIIDSGALDFKELRSNIAIYTKPSELEQTKKKLEEQSFVIIEANLFYKAKNPINLDEEQKLKIEQFIESLETLSEVTEIYTNLEENN